MNRILFLFGIFFSLSSWALVAPEIYMVDKNCPKNAPFKLAVWHYNDGKGYYTPADYEKCISCETTKGLVLSDEKECSICSNRKIVNHKECRLKICPKEYPYYESKWNWSGCKSCSDEPTHITKEECAQCQNMRWVASMKLCAPNKKGVMYYDGHALSIEGQERGLVGGMLPYIYVGDNSKEEVAIRADQSECAQCSKTTFKNGWCYLNQKGK